MKEYCSIVSIVIGHEISLPKYSLMTFINVLETQIKLLIQAGGETPMQTITEVTKLSQNNLVYVSVVFDNVLIENDTTSLY